MASMWESLGSMFGSPTYTNPAKAAAPYLEQVPKVTQPYYQPYIDTGQGAMNQYYGQMQQLGTPQGAMDIYNQMGAGYTQSPGYQYNIDQQTKSMGQSAAASGMAGTPSAQLALANQVSGMASQDYDNYMKMMMSLYDTGLGGLGDLTHQGYGASTGYADLLGRNMTEQAGNAYAGAANQNKYYQALAQQGSSNLSSILGLAGAIGGAAMGVPNMGGLAGSSSGLAGINDVGWSNIGLGW